MAKRFGIPAKRQHRLMTAIERAHEPSIAAVLARGYLAALDGKPSAEHEQEVRNALTGMAQLSVRVFANETNKAFAKAERKDFAGTVAKWAFRYIALEAFRRRITAISETTRSQVIDAVRRGFDDGLGQDGIGQYVRDLIPTFSRQRANLIARTETHGAANYGMQAAAADTGLVLRKEWISAEDARTRPDHADMSGKTVAIDEAFDFGAYSLAYPGDPSGPAEGVINCRCTIGYIPE